jgi:hypothetical protein
MRIRMRIRNTAVAGAAMLIFPGVPQLWKWPGGHNQGGRAVEWRCVATGTSAAAGQPPS